MTSLQCKMELVKNLFAMVKPKRQKVRSIVVEGYGPFDEYEEEEYLINYYEGVGDKS